MASATHLIPTSPLSVMVPNPRRGICRPLLRVTSGTKFFWVLVFDAANDGALPRLRNMAEAAHPALVCKNWRRLIPLELRSLFILVDFPYSFQPTTSAGLFCDSLPAPQIGKFFLARIPCISRMRRHLLRGFQHLDWPAVLMAAGKGWPTAKTGTPPGAEEWRGNESGRSCLGLYPEGIESISPALQGGQSGTDLRRVCERK